MSEGELVKQVRAGNGAAQRRLYDLHVDRVYRLTYRLSGDDDLAREFTQDTFVRAFDRIDGFRGDAALSTWLHSIAVSVTLNGLRKIKRIRSRETALHDGIPARGFREPEPDLKERMKQAIDGLPERCRVVFVMHDVEGYTHREIGEVLEISDGTSKAQLFRARGRLREALSEFSERYSNG